MLGNHHPKRYAKSFKYAFEGLDYVIKTQPNFSFHIVIALLVSILAYILNFSALEWVALLLTTGFVLTLELVNTIFEVLVDHLWQEEHPRAKIIKDVAAGTVLVGAGLAVLIGCVLFVPHVLKLIIHN